MRPRRSPPPRGCTSMRMPRAVRGRRSCRPQDPRAPRSAFGPTRQRQYSSRAGRRMPGMLHARPRPGPAAGPRRHRVMRREVCADTPTGRRGYFEAGRPAKSPIPRLPAPRERPQARNGSGGAPPRQTITRQATGARRRGPHPATRFPPCRVAGRRLQCGLRACAAGGPSGLLQPKAEEGRRRGGDQGAGWRQGAGAGRGPGEVRSRGAARAKRKEKGRRYSVLNEWPQEHDFVTFGLLILKPEPMRLSM